MRKLISIISFLLLICVMLCSCSKNVEPLSKVFEQIKSEVGVSEMVEFGSVSDLDRFYGIAAEDIGDFAGGINNSGVNQEEIVLVKASSSDAAERIKTALTNRYNSKLNETKNYNPEQYAIIEKCSVETNDLYVSLIISEKASAMREILNKAISGK